MNLLNLNVDVLLHLVKFLGQEDRLNLMISGVWKVFEGTSQICDLGNYSNVL